MVAVIDLRSDTVTLPTPEMREAMYRAEVGDDVYGEDPTVDRLQKMAAERLGKEAALFTTSGTQSNLVGVLTHCGRGDEVIVGDQAHIFHYEVGGVSALGGIMVRTVANRSGAPDPADVLAALRDPANVHHPISRLVCLENTHNRCGGVALTREETVAVADVAHEHGLKVHLDGARLFNAAVALGVDARTLAEPCDSVNICLSKGLCAPVGSLLVGSAEFIARARRNRKMVGGGMRQVGVLAAAGIVALEKMVDRLAEDHANARVLAETLAGLPGMKVNLKAVQTNIVVAELNRQDMNVAQFLARAKEQGVKISPFGGNKVRFVTHHGITQQDVESACRVVKGILAA
ncbi:MAG TPA: low-specificity L-threonine aldolase [Chloroflexota bacterium]|nr:low-specificity L-threonine aldolase [Chloroflexota bacterium]